MDCKGLGKTRGIYNCTSVFGIQLEIKDGFKLLGLEIYPIYGENSSGDSKGIYYFANVYTGIFTKIFQ